MAQLHFDLHEKQSEVFHHPARFKVVAAGRQSGKTTLATVVMTVAGLSDVSWGGVPLDSTFEVAYIYPTFEAGKKNVWPRLKKVIEPIIDSCSVYENTGLIVFPNGRRLRLFGTDDPDSLRGFTWSHVVLDEYKDMPDHVWQEVVRPALSVARGSALFIGTPKGKNHFYELYRTADQRMEDGDPEWAAFTFTSEANPAINRAELLSMTKDMSTQLVHQEIEASFISSGGQVFKADEFIIDSNEPSGGEWVVAVDPAGFSKPANQRNAEYKRRDETAITIAKVSPEGWWVKEIRHGRWEVRETALQILQAARSVGTGKVGIEKGMALNAMYPYLTDLMRQFNRWVEIVPLSHGNQRKYDRIQWALQGRVQKGRIRLNPGAWNAKLIEQACDFPDSKSHDDLLDSLAYVDQVTTTVYMDEFEGLEEEYQPQDALTGY